MFFVHARFKMAAVVTIVFIALCRQKFSSNGHEIQNVCINCHFSRTLSIFSRWIKDGGCSRHFVLLVIFESCNNMLKKMHS